jgi:acyl-CoA reductase-like NAD-dependent aldehyde dehydrogenase
MSDDAAGSEEQQSEEPSLREALALLNQLSPEQRRAVLRRIRQQMPEPEGLLARLILRGLETLRRLLTPEANE